MELTVTLPDQLVQAAQERAFARGITVDQLVSEYLQDLAAKPDHAAAADEFLRLSRLSKGDSRGWKFNREELHERR